MNEFFVWMIFALVAFSGIASAVGEVPLLFFANGSAGAFQYPIYSNAASGIYVNVTFWNISQISAIAEANMNNVTNCTLYVSAWNSNYYTAAYNYTKTTFNNSPAVTVGTFKFNLTTYSFWITDTLAASTRSTP